MNIEYNTVDGMNWSYITFPKKSSLAHFFFIDYHINNSENETLLIHKNKMEGINEVWVEGDEYVTYFLRGLGLKSVSKLPDIEYGFCERFLTSTGSMTIVPVEYFGKRSRIISISFQSNLSAEFLKINFAK